MKALLIITALFGFQVATAFRESSGEELTVNAATYTFCVDCHSLLPVVPLEASYEDQKEVVTLMDAEKLAPSVPLEADFKDIP
ncbi:MAG: hypothetical protein D4R67_03135 [Bacteroidetes bacterium]|nr:MAG: hypothetical protein D4R67_03135 [Bacteroidota bacterium]